MKQLFDHEMRLNLTDLNYYYRPPVKLQKGNVFRPICLSVSLPGLGLLGSTSNCILYESIFERIRKFYSMMSFCFSNKTLISNWICRHNKGQLLAYKKVVLNFVIHVDKFASSAKCSEKVECLPWDDGNHSAAVFDGCTDVHMYRHSGCKISSMKTQTVSKLFWLEVPYNFFYNPAMIIYTGK